MTTMNDIAQRFRPLLKFSIDGSAEPVSPCTWQWFGEHSKAGATYLDVLHRADVRLPGGVTNDVVLAPRDDAREGPGWQDIRSGAALYCHVSSLDRGAVVASDVIGPMELVNLEYWVLFPYNKSSLRKYAPFDVITAVAAEAKVSHAGDLVCVQMVYDAATDRIVRVAFPIHGEVLEAFDLAGATEETTALSGLNFDGVKATMAATKHAVAAQAAYQHGPSWHSPAHREVFFAKDPASGEYAHLAVFLEWGAHEAWPNPGGSATLAPKHRGDGFSFLPERCHVLDAKTDEAFVYFGGKLGDPTSLMRHRSWLLDTAGPAVADADRSDVSPYEARGPLPWPPPGSSEHLDLLVHLQGEGDRTFHQGELAGSRGKSKRLEGFQLAFPQAITGLDLEYMAHLQGSGDTEWVGAGTFVGTRGKALRVEGFAIRATGPRASAYDVSYGAYLQGTGETDIYRNGAFCGSRGQSRRLEGMWVRLTKRAAEARTLRPARTPRVP